MEYSLMTPGKKQDTGPLIYITELPFFSHKIFLKNKNSEKGSEYSFFFAEINLFP